MTARTAWVIVLGVCTALFVLTRQVFLITGNGHLWAPLLLVGTLTLPATVVSFAYGLSPRFAVGPALLIVVAAGGGVLGVVLAGLVEYLLSGPAGAPSAGAVAVTEEIAKLIVPLVVLLAVGGGAGRGLILGMAAGAGFAVIETLGYAGTAVLRSGASVTFVDRLMLDRGLLSSGTHIAWTGLASAGLGLLILRVRQRRRIAGAAGCFVLIVAAVVVAHAGWDASIGELGSTLLTVSSVAALLAAVYRLGVSSGRSDLLAAGEHRDAPAEHADAQRDESLLRDPLSADPRSRARFRPSRTPPGSGPTGW